MGRGLVIALCLFELVHCGNFDVLFLVHSEVFPQWLHVGMHLLACLFKILCKFLDLTIEYIETTWVYSKAIVVNSYIT